MGAVTSSIGTWMQKVAQGWLIVTMTESKSAFFLGLNNFLGRVAASAVYDDRRGVRGSARPAPYDPVFADHPDAGSADTGRPDFHQARPYHPRACALSSPAVPAFRSQARAATAFGGICEAQSRGGRLETEGRVFDGLPNDHNFGAVNGVRDPYLTQTEIGESR